MVLPRSRLHNEDGARRMRVPRAEPYIAAFLLMFSSLSLLPIGAAADPVDTDNPDDTRTLVWDFEDDDNYSASNVEVASGSATLRFMNESYSVDTASEYYDSSLVNVDMATVAGSVVLDETASTTGSLTIQLDSTGIDSYITEDKANDNYGLDTDLRIDSDTGRSMRAVLRFDLSSVPWGATVDSATLWLYGLAGSKGGDVHYDVHALADNTFVEDQVTWNRYTTSGTWTTPGGDFLSYSFAYGTFATTTGWKATDVTRLVDLWVEGKIVNRGLIIVPVTAGGDAVKVFQSSDATGETQQNPRLVVNYTVAGAVGAAESDPVGPGTNATFTFAQWGNSTRSLITDEFDGSSLDDGWSWLNDPVLDGGAYDVGAHRSGWLHIEGAELTEMLDDTTSANYLRKTVTGDFEATLSLDESFTDEDMGAGLLVMEDESDWAYIAKTNTSGTSHIEVVVCEEGTSAVSADLAWPALSNAFLRSVRDDTGLSMYASEDGIDWTLVHWYEPQVALAERNWIGLFVYSLVNVEPVVEFDFIRVEPLAEQSFDLMFRTGNSTDTTDPSWEDWGATVGPYSFVPLEKGRYAQFRIYLETDCEWVTPQFTGLTLWCEHYAQSGNVETLDYEPADFSMWYTLTTSETNVNGTARYYFSTDRGVSWTYAGTGGSYTIMSAEPTLRVRVALESHDTAGSPAAHSITVVYGTSLSTFFVLAPATVVAGEAFQVTVYAKDSYNSTMIHWTGPVTLEAMDPTATIAASDGLEVGVVQITTGGYTIVPNERYTAAETITIVARSGDAFGVSEPIQVVADEVSRVVITPDISQVVELDSESLHASAYDQYGNEVTGVTFTWSVWGGIGILNRTYGSQVLFTASAVGGSGYVNVTVGGVASASLAIEVVAPAHEPYFLAAIPDQQKTEDFGSWSFDISTYVADQVDSDDDLRWYATGEDNVTITGENQTGMLTITFSTIQDLCGLDFVQIHVVDPTGMEAVDEVLIDILPVNDGPSIDTIDPLVVTGGMPYPFNFRYYVQDVDTDYNDLVLTVDDDSSDYCLITRLTVMLTYPVEMVGQTTMLVATVSDGSLDSSTIVQVTVSEDAVPAVTDELPDVTMYEGEARLKEFDLDDYFMDPDGDALTFSCRFDHVWVNITSDHWVNFFAPMDWYGEEYAVFMAVDIYNARTEVAVLVTVLPVNQAPSIEGVPDLMVRYDQMFEYDLLPYIEDPDDPLGSITVSTNDSFISIMGATLCISYPYEFNGTVRHVRITVTDGELSAMCNIAVTVSANSPPSAEQMPDHQFLEDIPLPYPLNGDLEDFFLDPEEGQVADIESFAWNDDVIASSTPIGLNDWLMNFATEPDWYGETYVTVRAMDSEGALVEKTFTLTVVSAPDAPSIDGIPDISVNPGVMIAVDVAGYIDDPDTDPAQFSYAVTGGSEAQYVNIAAGLLMVEFPEDFLGRDDRRTVTVTVTVLDQDGLSDDDEVTITVIAIQSGGLGALELFAILAMGGVAIGSFAVAMGMRRRPFVIRDLLLVHNDGFLIGRHAAKQAGEIDEDVLTGMLTAVLNFVEDSMATSQDELKSFGFRDYQVLVKRGWKAYIAVVYSGDAPEGIQSSLGSLLDKIEKIYRKALQEWTGDIEVEFAGIEHLLQAYVKDHGRHGRRGDKGVRLWQGKKKATRTVKPKLAKAVEGGSESEAGQV